MNTFCDSLFGNIQIDASSEANIRTFCPAMMPEDEAFFSDNSANLPLTNSFLQLTITVSFSLLNSASCEADEVFSNTLGNKNDTPHSLTEMRVNDNGCAAGVMESEVFVTGVGETDTFIGGF